LHEKEGRSLLAQVIKIALRLFDECDRADAEWVEEVRKKIAIPLSIGLI